MDEKFYEIFRAGNYPQRSVSEQDIQTIAENYDPEFCEAPISIFHWGDGFAYGWIKELKAEGDRLMASFRDVTEDLKGLVAQKKLKRHSIELFEDLDEKGLYLKALAMLGTDTPAVKGMQPIEFKEGGAVEYTFEEMPSFADDLAVDYYKNIADQAKADRDRLETELTQEKEKSQNFASEKEQLEFNQRKEKFESFLDSKTDAGILEPKLRDKAVNLFKHLDKVSQEQKEDETKAVDLFKDIIDAFKKQATFGEEFTEGETETTLTPKQLSDKITAYMQEQKTKGVTVSYTEALNHVKNQNQPNK